MKIPKEYEKEVYRLMRKYCFKLEDIQSIEASPVDYPNESGYVRFDKDGNEIELFWAYEWCDYDIPELAEFGANVIRSLNPVDLWPNTDSITICESAEFLRTRSELACMDIKLKNGYSCSVRYDIDDSCWEPDYGHP